jgi:hypothetical protein
VEVERAVSVHRDAYEIDGLVRVVLEFRSLIATDGLFGDGRPRSAATLYANVGSSPSIYDVASVWGRSFALFESTRGIVDTFMFSLPQGQRPVLASTRVERLRLESPFQIEALSDPLLWPVVLYLFHYVRVELAALPAMRNAEAEERRAEAQEGRAADFHDVELRSRMLDLIKTGLEVEQMIRALEEPLRAELDLDEEVEFKPDSERLDALKNQALEAITEIALGSNGDFGFTQSETQAAAPDADRLELPETETHGSHDDGAA